MSDEKWPADKIIRMPIGKLTPYARNARTHSDAQVAQIAASMREWGWTNPVLIDENGGIIAGHGRVLAARQLGIKDVPCMVATGWTEAQKRAYVLADNKLALNAGWDDALLSIELKGLDADGFDIGLIGFGDDELAGLLADKTDGLTDPDDVPEVPDEPVTKLGDVWMLGKHRLMCGDSTSIYAVDKLMAGQKADLCFTSPPYAQQREYKKEISDWDGLMNGVFAALPVKDGAQILVNLGLVHEKGRVNAYWDAWLDFMDANGWPLFGWYVWDKGFGLPGNWNGRLAPAHEFIFHFSKGGNKPANKWVDKNPKYIKEGSGKAFRQKDGSTKAATSPQASMQPTKIADSVIRVTPQMARNIDTSHPAMFPVALCEAMYKSYAKAGDWAFEPFSGSGTSIIACEGMGMNCAAMELAPEYVDVAVKRWQDFTGLDAIHEETGQTFATMLANRQN
jgi:DNA modification methylase